MVCLEDGWYGDREDCLGDDVGWLRESGGFNIGYYIGSGLLVLILWFLF